MRWIVSIIVSVAFMAGVASYYTLWSGFQADQKKLAELRRQVGDYEKVESLYNAQRDKIAVVNKLWGEIKDVEMTPDKWVTYPLSIGKTLEWKDLDRLMVLSANRSEGDYYWFVPQTLRVSRVLQNPDVENGGTGVEGQEAPTESARLDETSQDVVQRYETRLVGAFLIPKESAQDEAAN